MDKKELLKRFEETGGGSEWLKMTFTMLIEECPKKAEILLECMQGCNMYNNFLSESEATRVVDGFVNYDGTAGAKWTADDLFSKVESLGVPDDVTGMFNKWALYATMNMISSDCGNVILRWVKEDSDKYAEACYELAVSHLKDKDKPKFIRWYFGLL